MLPPAKGVPTRYPNRLWAPGYESLESAVGISQGHLEDVAEDPNLSAIYRTTARRTAAWNHQQARLSGNYEYKNREYIENNKESKRGLARLIIFHGWDIHTALERASVPHTRQHLHQCIEPSLVRSASSAFVFFIYTPVEGGKDAFSGRYLKTSVTPVKQAHEIVVVERSYQAAPKYI